MSPAAQDNTPAEPESAGSDPTSAQPESDEAAGQAIETTVQAPRAKGPAAKVQAAEAPAAEVQEAEAPADEAPAEKAPAEKAPAKAAAEKAPAAKGSATKGSAAKGGAASKPKAAAPSHGVVAVDLPSDIFDATVNVPLIHQVVVAQQAAARQGTHSTKTRGEVRGGGKKPYRQKGTGRARQGSIRAPHFTGGGVVHGPVPRSHAQKTPKKMKSAALRGALSDRARHGLVLVVDGFVDGAEPKTRDALAVLTVVTGAAAGPTSVLVVAESSDKVTWKSLRNAPGVHLIDPGQLNTYDVLVSDQVVFTATALASFVARAGAAGRQEEQER